MDEKWEPAPSLARSINLLRGEDAMQRIRGLDECELGVFGDIPIGGAVSGSRWDYFVENVLVEVLRLLGDGAERVRARASSFLHRIAARASVDSQGGKSGEPVASRVVGSIVDGLNTRIGVRPSPESSEEIRLEGCRILLRLLRAGEDWSEDGSDVPSRQVSQAAATQSVSIVGRPEGRQGAETGVIGGRSISELLGGDLARVVEGNSSGKGGDGEALKRDRVAKVEPEEEPKRARVEEPTPSEKARSSGEMSAKDAAISSIMAELGGLSKKRQAPKKKKKTSKPSNKVPELTKRGGPSAVAASVIQQTSLTTTAAAAAAEEDTGSTSRQKGVEREKTVSVSVEERMRARAAVAEELGSRLDAVSSIISHSSQDVYPEVKRCSSSCALALSSLLPDRIPAVAAAIARAQLGNVRHQRHIVRREALEAAVHLATSARGWDSRPVFLMEELVPMLETVGAGDRSPHVRKAAADAACRLLVTLPPGETRDVLPLLVRIPLARTGDLVAEVASAALASLEHAANHLGAEAVQPPSNSANDLVIAQTAASPDGVEKEESEGKEVKEEEREEQDVELPDPFEGRPSRKLRELVGKVLESLVGRLSTDLGSWREPERLEASAALRATLVCVEDAATVELPRLVSALCASVRDESGVVRSRSAECASLLGAFVAPGALAEALLPLARGQVAGRGGVEHRAAALAVLADVVGGMGEEEARELLPAVGAALIDETLLESMEAQAGIVRVVDAASEVILPSDAWTDFARALLLVDDPWREAADPDLVRLEAGETGRGSVAAGASAASRRLALAVGVPNVYEAVGETVLVHGERQSSKWNAEDVNRRRWDAVLRLAPATAAAFPDAVLVAIQRSVDPERSPELRLRTLATVRALLAAASDTVETQNVATAARHFGIHPPDTARRATLRAQLRAKADALASAIAPNLVWRVGHVAAAVRRAAAACLAAATDAALFDARTAVAALARAAAPLASALADDDAATRKPALLALSGLLDRAPEALDGEALRALSTPILARLDDAEDTIRILACQALARLVHAGPKEHAKGAPVEHATDALLVHADDPDETIQKAAHDALRALAHVDPEYVAKEASKHRARHRSPDICDDLVNLCTQLQEE